MRAGLGDDGREVGGVGVLDHFVGAVELVGAGGEESADHEVVDAQEADAEGGARVEFLGEDGEGGGVGV